METSNKQYRQIIRFANTALAWQAANITPETPSGFRYAIRRVMKGLERILEDYNDAISDINMAAAAEDEHGVMVTDERGAVKMTKDAAIKRTAEIRQLLEREVASPMYFAKTAPSDLTDLQLTAFEGFVLKDADDPDV